MTEEELDEYFICTLKKILEEVKDCKDYVKDLHTPEYDEINADYDEQIEELSSIIKEVSSVDDLAQMDEETITAVYDFIADYADNFLIAPDGKQQEKDWAEYDKLEELLDLFMDTEEDDSEDEE